MSSEAVVGGFIKFMCNMEDRNFEVELARFIVEKTRKSLFLTGKAGTGKTTFLRDITRHTKKKHIVLAPTGVAAVNAGAMTIHSFFQFGLGAYVPGVVAPQTGYLIRKAKLDLIRNLDLIIIDEISMVRADLLDHIDAELRRIRRSYLPFGGVQLLMIGDLQQLPPIAHGEEEMILRQHYKSLYFFDCKALQNLEYSCIELKNVYRQNDSHFVDILNRARIGRLTPEDIDELNTRYQPRFMPRPEDNYIRLVTHNRMVQNVNEGEMTKLDGDEYAFDAKVTGTFPTESFPTAERLVLKKGAQVMFIKNDPDKRFINGTLGEVCYLWKDKIKVRIADTGVTIDVEPMEWENIRYQLEETDKTVKSTTIGKFRQYPVRPAWAITIHKSQGLTFDRAIIDARAAFSPGQAYVALSRCRSLEGIVLSSPLRASAFMTDTTIDDFLQSRLADARALASEVSFVPFDYDRSKDKPEPKIGNKVASRPSVGIGGTEGINTKLVAALKSWRLEKAHELNVPAFYIFSNKVLDNIAAYLPHTQEELLEVPGIGPAKAEGYGAAILKIVQENCDGTSAVRSPKANEQATAALDKFRQSTPEAAPTIPQTKRESKAANADAPKIPSQQISFDMFRSGKTVEEIAAERGMSPSTIETHLCKYVESGDIDVRKIVPEDTIAKVLFFRHAHPDATHLKDIYDAYQGTIPYSHIRFVLASMK